jgi:peptide-methionine (R)-S-oxide reductase
MCGVESVGAAGRVYFLFTAAEDFDILDGLNNYEGVLKMNRRSFLSSGLAFGAVALACASCPAFESSALPLLDKRAARRGALPFEKVSKTDAEWRRILTPEQYQMTRMKATESPYSSPLNKVNDKGTFACVCCGLALFSSKTKFDSGTGWPSFWAPIAKANVREEVDRSLSEERTEVLCARCDAHLGHVFDDGPEPTGLRYCMNGVALKFVKSR